MKRDSGAIAISVAALRRLLLVVAGLVVFLAIGAAAYSARDAIRDVVSSVVAGGVGAQIDKNSYQSVFLTSGQLYFGHAEQRGDVLLLRDVYYLANATKDSPKGELIKRGNEIHGPREPMIIPVRQVLFLENMRPDSEVVTAIERSHSGGAQTPSQPQPATQPPQPSLPQASAAPETPSPTGRPSPTPTR